MINILDPDYVCKCGRYYWLVDANNPPDLTADYWESGKWAYFMGNEFYQRQGYVCSGPYCNEELP